MCVYARDKYHIPLVVCIVKRFFSFDMKSYIEQL
jgi:hypothetical protein